MRRLKGYDYRWHGQYFVTIVTKNRTPHFGFIRDRVMCVSEIGALAYQCWDKITEHFSNIEGDCFIVMPDHIHGIINIYPDHEIHDKDFVWTPSGTLKNSLSAAVGSFKSAVSRRIHIEGYPEFHWQRGFYDRIIRNEAAYRAICNYIANNPANYYRVNPDNV